MHDHHGPLSRSKGQNFIVVSRSTRTYTMKSPPVQRCAIPRNCVKLTVSNAFHRHEFGVRIWLGWGKAVFQKRVSASLRSGRSSAPPNTSSEATFGGSLSLVSAVSLLATQSSTNRPALHESHTSTHSHQMARNGQSSPTRTNGFHVDCQVF